MSFAIYQRLCPNCGGLITTDRLEKGLPCERCLPNEGMDRQTRPGLLCQLLRKRGSLQNYEWVCRLHKQESHFERFFRRHLGFDLWGVQRLWARRVLLGESFAMVAPTGVGKTTFGIAMAHFLDGLAYLIVPTKALVQQVTERCGAFGTKKVVGYQGRADERKAIEAGDYEILVTTSIFLSRNFELLQKRRFRFVFVDDVDALLKSGRNVDKVLQLLGITDKEIEQAWAQISKKSSQVSSKDSGDVANHQSETALTLNSAQPYAQSRDRGLLVVSSATLRPRTSRVALFRALLGFELSPVKMTFRNVCDAVVHLNSEDELKSQLLAWIRRLGKGGLIFVPGDKGREGVKEVVDFLRQNKIHAAPYDELDLESFRAGRVEIAVGIAVPNNALVRGIDLPETIRYTIFVDVPRMSFPVNLENPRNYSALLFAIREVSEDKGRIDAYLATLRRYTYLREGRPLPKRVQEIKEYLKNQFSQEDLLAKLETAPTVQLARKNGQLFVLFGDATTYIQASGRTSRLFLGGVSRGISLILVQDRKAFHSLIQRLRLLGQEIEFLDAKGVDWEAELQQVDADRERIRRLLVGRSKPVARFSVQHAGQPEIRSTLVIVESPNKARTIAHFFGTPQRRMIKGLSAWEVTTGDRLLAISACLGHVFDLTEQDGVYGVLVQNNAFVPVYDSIKICPQCGEQRISQPCPCGKIPSQDKMTLVQALQQVATQFDEIIIATDPDAEGEKIGYDMTVALKPFNLNIVRAEFHEVTRRAFLQALQKPRQLVHSLIRAQVTRRILDRWVGFELSHRLWEVFSRHYLSAGRVQTTVLGWIIERTDQARQKKARITVELSTPDEDKERAQFTFELEDTAYARKLLNRLDEAQVVVSSEYEDTVSPPPPYNTGTLLAEAGSFASASAIMNTLQELFERGLITYHRTDSVRVSDAGLHVAEQILSERYDPALYQPRRYGTEGAHECIRPSRPLTEDDLRVQLSIGHIHLKNPRLALRLYGMIIRRFLASQMKPAKVRKAKITLQVDDWKQDWEVIVDVLEEGFHKVLPLKVHRVFQNMKVANKNLRLVAKVAPYTQGTLIEQMRQRGLGRPSTYAKIVQTLLDRGYVVEKKGYLFATELGRKVYQWLHTHFPEFAEESFTYDLEEKIDRIEANELDYQQVLHQLSQTSLLQEKIRSFGTAGSS